MDLLGSLWHHDDVMMMSWWCHDDVMMMSSFTSSATWWHGKRSNHSTPCLACSTYCSITCTLWVELLQAQFYVWIGQCVICDESHSKWLRTKTAWGQTSLSRLCWWFWGNSKLSGKHSWTNGCYCEHKGCFFIAQSPYTATFAIPC